MGSAGIIDYHYDENNYKGNLTSVHYPNGTYTTYGYDTRNRLVSLANNGPGGIISQYTYTLDAVGNKINVSVEEPLSWTLLPGSIDYDYEPGNFLTSAGTATYQYDDNGNLYTKTKDSITTTHTFDSQDRLTNVSSPSVNIQYQYDGLFNRVSKTASGTVTRYLVDPNGFLPQVIAEMDGAYNITDYYVYDGMGLVAKISGSNVYYYHYDGSANTIAMTDTSGNMVNKYAYDQFGNLLNVVEMVPNPFTFVGRYGVMDDDSGLYYMRARYYDPEVGRFINKDPIRYLGGDPNLYCYTKNNPVNWVDPSGELFSPVGAAVGGIVGGISGGIIASFGPNASLGSIATAVAVGAAGGAIGAAGGAIGGLFDVSMGAAAGLGAGIGAGTAVVNGSNIGGIIGGAMGGAIGGAFVIISGGGIGGVATGAFIGAWNAWLFEKAGNAIYNEWIKKNACSAY